MKATTCFEKSDSQLLQFCHEIVEIMHISSMLYIEENEREGTIHSVSI